MWSPFGSDRDPVEGLSGNGKANIYLEIRILQFCIKKFGGGLQNVVSTLSLHNGYREWVTAPVADSQNRIIVEVNILIT